MQIRAAVLEATGGPQFELMRSGAALRVVIELSRMEAACEHR
ncbi:MAG: hypothetical protein ACR2G9_01200 [Gaiellaceae bacterium]